MKEIPVFRTYAERIEKSKFVAIAEHLGLRGNPIVTKEALFLQDKQRALAYALPGSGFGGLLFFTDQSLGMATPIGRFPSKAEVENWTNGFLKRFQLGLHESTDKNYQPALTIQALLTESVIEEGKEGKGVKRVPAKMDIVSELRLNEWHVTGPRAKVRLVFKSAKAPILIHRALWDKFEVFETRPLLTENDAFRRLSDQLSRRGETLKRWRMLGIRLAYFAGEYCGGPDLLLPYYFAEIEFHDTNQGQGRQGPRQLIQIPACW